MLRRSSIALALLTLSCSGASTQDVLVGTGTGTSNSSNGSNGSSGTPGTSSGTPGASSGNPGPGSSSGEPSKACTDKQREIEPNDGRQDATALNPLLCGTLSRDDVRDYIQFRLKQRTTEMFILFSGRIRLSVTVPGHTTFEMSASNSPNIPLVHGEDYSIEVSALNEEADSTEWRVELVERP